MKKILLQSLIPLCVLMLFSCKSNKGNSSKIASKQITVTMVSEYCGGANPSAEVLEDLKKPKPAGNMDVVLVDNEKQIPFATDENGLSSISLKPGKYQVFLAEKLDATAYSANVEAICDKWKAKPNGSLEVLKGQDSIEVEISKDCNPCNQPSY